jgi:hypothetical protein
MSETQTQRIVDISYTCKASELQGKRLMKNLDNGVEWWEMGDTVETEIDKVEVAVVKPKRGAKKK